MAHSHTFARWLRGSILAKNCSVDPTQDPMDLILQMKLYNDMQMGNISVGASKESAMRPYRDVLLRKDLRLFRWRIG